MKDDIENLYQKGKIEKSPASLDNFILSQAKNSCHDKQVVMNGPKKRNPWIFRLSTAAVLVMSFSIILKLQNENEFISEPVEYMQNNSSPKKTMQTEKELNTAKPVNQSIENIVEPGEESNQFSQPEVELSDTVTEEVPVPVPATVASDIEVEATFEINIKNETIKAVKRNLEYKELETKVDEALVNKSKDTSVVSETIMTESLDNNVDDVATKESQEAVLQAPKTPLKSAQDNLESDDLTAYDGSEKLDKIIVTGARLARGSINESTKINEEILLTQKLEKLDSLIKDKRIDEAKLMLKQLQEIYPNHNFSQYKDL